MNKTIFLFLCLFPALAWPQEPDMVTKIVRVRNVSAKKITDVVAPSGHVIITADDSLKAIVIKGKASDVTAAEAAVRELDSVPSSRGSRNIELTVYLLSGSNSSGEDKTPAMAPVIKQLRTVFPYSNYQLLSTMLLRSSEGAKTGSSGLLKGFGNSAEHPSVYRIGYDSAAVSPEEAAPTIHLSQFRFTAQVAAGSAIYDVGLGTDVDLREGQKVVVGKSNIDNVDSALFVVLVAKLMQ